MKVVFNKTLLTKIITAIGTRGDFVEYIELTQLETQSLEDDYGIVIDHFDSAASARGDRFLDLRDYGPGIIVPIREPVSTADKKVEGDGRGRVPIAER